VQYDAIAARPIDSWLVYRVEAIGGPSSFLNGSGAVGGSINVITKIADRRGELSQLRVGGGDQRQLALSLRQAELCPALHASHTLYGYDTLRDYENVEVYSFVNNNRQVQRSSALRADHINLGVSNLRTVTASNPALFDIRFKPVTGRLGLVKDLSPAWQVYAQYSTAADPPSGVLATAG